MFKRLLNQQGGVLVYVLVVAFLLMLLIPNLFSKITTTQINEQQVVHQKKATTLAVNAMNNFQQSSENKLEQKQYLLNHYAIEPFEIVTPQAHSIYLYQYAVSENDPPDLSNALSKAEFENNNDDYKVVITAISGDLHNIGEEEEVDRFFYQKQLTDLVEMPKDENNGQTPAPVIPNPIMEHQTVINGTSIANAFIKVMDSNDLLLNSIRADDAGIFSIDVRPLIEGEVLTITATGNLMEESPPVYVTVYADSKQDNFDGFVRIIDETDGSVSYEEFNGSNSTTEKMVVTSNVGEFQTNEKIVLSADEGITIEEDVNLTTASNGNDVGLTLHSNNGDIIIKNTTLVDLANSNFNHIDIDAAGDVDLQNATLYAVRNITITAGGNIYGQHASLTSNQNNGNIQFHLTGGGTLFIDGMEMNKNATATGTNSYQICGELAGNTNINGISNYPCN